MRLAARVLSARIRRFLVTCAAGILAGCGTFPPFQMLAQPQTGASGEADGESRAWPVYRLERGAAWPLTPPDGERFDASTLHFHGADLWTLNDRSHRVYAIRGLETGAARLEPVPGLFTKEQLAAWSQKGTLRFDFEGITEDARGRVYICEEQNRWILRWDPVTQQIERLDIDWSPVQSFFHPSDRNASFEGVAIEGNQLFVANERQQGRIIVVDLDSLEVTGHFAPRPLGDPEGDAHYSDLCVFEGALFVLDRRHQTVLKVDPASYRVLAEYHFQGVEFDRAFAFATLLPIGFMEGLAVDARYFWLVTDNNGFARRSDWKDRRPVLFRCERPDQPRLAP